jgi:hypothetical protein
MRWRVTPGPATWRTIVISARRPPVLSASSRIGTGSMMAPGGTGRASLGKHSIDQNRPIGATPP